jgi:hypothetical protein
VTDSEDRSPTIVPLSGNIGKRAITPTTGSWMSLAQTGSAASRVVLVDGVSAPSLCWLILFEQVANKLPLIAKFRWCCLRFGEKAYPVKMMHPYLQER